MADNFLEKQYADYEARKAAQAKAKRLAWQKKMKEYQARLAMEKTAGADSSTKPHEGE